MEDPPLNEEPSTTLRDLAGESANATALPEGLPPPIPGPEYKVTMAWTGWFGGWGREYVLEDHLKQMSQAGWRLLRTEGRPAFWMWLFWRYKLLMIWERAERP
jgi:hypothetical protein